MRFFLIFVLLPFAFVAQDYTKLKVKKQNQYFYFFQLSNPGDTVSDNENDLFFMKISREKRCSTRIEVQNGQLQRSQSDTIFKLVYLRNMNYRHFFTDSIPNEQKSKHQKKSADKKNPGNCIQYKTEVNGANNGSDSQLIIVKFVNALNDSVYITNKFYYK